MTEENIGSPEPEETVSTEDTAAAQEAAFSSQESEQQNQESERDYEAEARDMGWVPEEEFKGDKKPKQFLSAQEFVERGETVLPLVRNENKRLKEQLDAEKKDFEQRIEKLSKASEASLKAQRQQYEERIASLNTERDKAVEAGDVESFRKLDKQIKDYEANAPETEAAPKPDEDPAKVEQDWLSRNTWYNEDEDMQRYALWYSHKIKAPDLPLSENLRRTEEAVKQQFPLKFGGKPAGANGHAPVEGGGDPKPSPRGSKSPTFDKLPAEAKEMAKRDVESGLYKTVEAWAQVYNS